MAMLFSPGQAARFGLWLLVIGFITGWVLGILS